MSKPVDLELKKAFLELQVKMFETRKKIQVIDTQIIVLKRLLQHVDITQYEIRKLPYDTNTFEAVGRMFIHTNLEQVNRNLNLRMVRLIRRTNDLEGNKEYLEKNLKESEDNIREMVQQRKDQIEKSA